VLARSTTALRSTPGCALHQGGTGRLESGDWCGCRLHAWGWNACQPCCLPRAKPRVRLGAPSVSPGHQLPPSTRALICLWAFEQKLCRSRGKSAPQATRRPPPCSWGTPFSRCRA